MATRPRDSYRARVYEALGKVEHEKFDTYDSFDFVDKVTRKVWYRNRAQNILGNRQKPDVFFNPSTSNFCNPTVVPARDEYDIPTLTFAIPVYHRSDITLLHSLAHTMHPANTAWHGPEFAAVFLALVEHDLSRDRRLEVSEAFHLTKVKTRTWNEKAREEAKSRRAQEQLLAMYAELSTPLMAPE